MGNETSFRGWVYRDLLRPIAEVDALGNVVARYVYSDGSGARQNGVDQLTTRLGANQDTSLPFSGSNVPEAIELLDASGAVTQTLMLSTNQVGSVQLVTDASTGEVVQRIEYDEFGRVLSDSAPGMQPFGFAGGLYDPESEVVRFGARDYAADVGRWIARDPVRLSAEREETNVYEYALSDPLRLIDPLGLQAGESACVNRCLDRYQKCFKENGGERSAHNYCSRRSGPRARNRPSNGAGPASPYARCRVGCGEDEPDDFDPNKDPICGEGF